jgi:peptidoglycan/xylan/chitin deacetylase (PgdA/CDA1 family)
MHRTIVAALCAATGFAPLLACTETRGSETAHGDTAVAPAADSSPIVTLGGEDAARPTAATSSAAVRAATKAVGTADGRMPNEMGRIPVLEYHLLGDSDSQWKVERGRFRRQLELLYERGYRPVNMNQLLDKKLDLPAGQSPVVFVFDDASPSQFSYVEKDGQLEVDPNSAVGILLDFNKKHPDWENRAVFCMLPAASAGHAFFGEKGISGQKTDWRFKKLRFLAEQGFELCNHTLYHANLGKQTDEKAQEFIARGQMAIDSAVPGYKVRTFALPLGVWPKNRPLAWAGSWRDPKTGKTESYRYEAVLEVSGGPTRSPHDPQFDPRHVTRVIVFNSALEKTLDQLDRSGERYVSDGDPNTIARPTAPIQRVAAK